MEKTPFVTMIVLAMLTATPSLASGISPGASTEESPVWLLEDKLRTSGPLEVGSHLGAQVAIEGDLAAAAAPGGEEVWVYNRSGFGWEPSATLSTGPSGEDFGRSIALDGDTIVVGARLADTTTVSFAGAAYVFERTAEGWTRTAKLIADDASRLDVFGQSVAVDGDTIAVGAILADDNRTSDVGAVYLFQVEDGGWEQSARLVPDQAGAGAHMGDVVALEGDHLLTSSGSQDRVFAFERDGSEWADAGVLEGPTSFGASLDVSNTRAAVGIPDGGEVRVFQRSGDGWHTIDRVWASDAWPLRGSAAFGTSVALDNQGDALSVGAPEATRGPGAVASPQLASPPCMGLAVTTTCQRSGAAYVFHASPQGDFSQTAKVFPPDGAPADGFGDAVDLDSDTGRVIAGAPDGDLIQDDGAGGAYVFQSATNLLPEGS